VFKLAKVKDAHAHSHRFRDTFAVAITAGRIMLARLHELAAQRADFAFETTLASHQAEHH
jgi:predicted ABC-type ATPase